MGGLYIFIFLHQTTTKTKPRYIQERLYIFIFLHQTTTFVSSVSYVGSLYIFIFLHQTTTVGAAAPRPQGCISLYSYIKPQPTPCAIRFDPVVYLYIPTSNHNAATAISCLRQVVYLYIPTSNHNENAWCAQAAQLYIFIFLHQTTTNSFAC